MRITRRTSPLLAALMAILLGECGTALAQYPGAPQSPLPITQPPFSPYLNLLRRGNSVGFNYYGLVRPELAFRNSIQGVQQQVMQNTQALEQPPTAADTRLPITGFVPSFMNTGGFFLTYNRGGTGGIGAGGSLGTTGNIGARPMTVNPGSVNTPRR